MRALRREARKGRCYLLSGAVARVGLAEGRGLFLKLFSSGRHDVVLKYMLLASRFCESLYQRPFCTFGLAVTNSEMPRSEPSPGRRRPGAGPAAPGLRARRCIGDARGPSHGDHDFSPEQYASQLPPMNRPSTD